MKYLAMIFTRTDQPWTGSDDDVAGMRALLAAQRELTATGELLGAEGLDNPGAAVTVDVRAGVPVVSDGPFAEAKEQLAGYFLLECSHARAVEVAARLADGVGLPVQLSPVVDQDVMRRAAGLDPPG